MPTPKFKPKPKPERGTARATCVCGAVVIEIDFPAFWAWHDHGRATQAAQGCAYATYVGTWKKRCRVKKGTKSLTTFADKKAKAVRSFCATCGTPMLYERENSPKWINIPRALFTTRTGREPRYHVRLEESPEWSYLGAPLSPLKGYPGVMIQRSKRKTATTITPRSHFEL